MTSKLEATRVFFLGVFPPPVHGASLINQRLQEEFSAVGLDVVRLDLVGPRLPGIRARGLLVLIKAFSVLWLLPRLLWGARHRGRKILYISTAGGNGKLFELPFLLLARLLRLEIWLHHHSFDYLDRPRGLTRVSLYLAGPAAVHVTLCRHMGARLCDLYGVPSERIRCLSNSGLIAVGPTPATVRQRLYTIGFLGNLMFEKGIQEFVAVCEALHQGGVDFRAQIAGPVTSPDTEQFMSDATKRIPELEMLGPCYGDAKLAFLDSIDLLLFPSRYRNEAEPLVIYEANSRGVYVLATGRGCIAEVLRDGGGEVLPSAEFVSVAQSRIVVWQQNPGMAAELSRSALAAMDQRRTTSRRTLQELTRELL